MISYILVKIPRKVKRNHPDGTILRWTALGKENARYSLILQCAILLWQCFRYTQNILLSSREKV